MQQVLKFIAAVVLAGGLVYAATFLFPVNTGMNLGLPGGAGVHLQRGKIVYDRAEKEVRTNGFKFLEEQLKTNAGSKEDFTFSIRKAKGTSDLVFVQAGATQSWVNLMVATNSGFHESAMQWASRNKNRETYIGTNSEFWIGYFEVAGEQEDLISFLRDLLSKVFSVQPEDGLVFDP